MPRTIEEIGRIAEAFVATCNGGEDALVAALVDRLKHEHRTIQAHALRAMIRVLRGVGERTEEFGTDLRNEAAIRWCRALAETDAPILRDGIAVW